VAPIGRAFADDHVEADPHVRSPCTGLAVKPGGCAPDQPSPLASVDGIFRVAIRTGASRLDLDECEDPSPPGDDVDLDAIGPNVAGYDPITSSRQVVGGAVFTGCAECDSVQRKTPGTGVPGG